MQSLKNSIFLAFKNDYKLLLLLSLPALALCAFGLYQLNEFTWATAPAALAAKLLCEFLFIGLLLSLAQICGLKNKGAVTVAAFLYYLTLTADFVLLWYFKERFGAKYLQTMEGGDYNFLTDWRVISYFVLLAAFCFFAVRKFFTASPRRTAAMRLGWCATGLLLFIFLPPLALLKAPHNFYAQYMLAPSPVYTARALLAKSPKAHIGTPSTEVQKLAESYGIWNAANTGVGKPYKRVILIAAESFSVKYLHRFNPKIPAEASREVDALMARYPSASLEHVTLSTLYGLSVIFTSHPFVKLAYENGYPDSFVRTLQQHGYRTAFLRGANEKYMDENILFHQAGFQEVIGRTYFETDPRYAPFINWWGLMDRKLFAYAAEYLQAHQNEPVFLTLLTVDTHVPLGRTDYAGETYREIDAPFYDTPTLPRAFARLGQDVQHFLQDLQARGLWDEDTLIIL
ncbi:sulfatase-like hydrolase/transferase, partial [Candidatus Avelusimicrobium faecicola]|uniref:sulfatase-like hydrolase/transferase n=1 Tax=Candidatus Avelusimicrobium faecicola TaxID=3416205 RepID=UPI003D0BD8D6